MFAKQIAWSASLLALCGAAAIARAEDDVSVQSEGEVHPPGETAPTPVETEPAQPPPPPPPKRPTGTFQIGAGFSSDESFIAAASISQDDLFHTGNHLSMHARLSMRRQLFLTRFADPDVLGSRLALTADIYNDKHQLPGFTREAAGGSLTLSYPIGEHTRAFVGYRLEDVKATSNGPVARTLEPLPPLTGGILSALRTGVVYDTLDRPDAPMRGTQLGASIEVADRRLGSDLTFIKTDAWAQHHQPIGPLTLHLSGSLTTIGDRIGPSFSTIGGSGGAPRSELLFLDNSNEIRGYRPDSFGPVDALGRPVGGNAKVLGSVELEVPLVRRIGLSAIGFADAGGLLDRSGQGQLGLSLGFGLLWRSPIGPLKFSWALPVDGPGPAFVFGIGSGF